MLELFREEIAEAVKRADFKELKSVVKSLQRRRKKTEHRPDSLIVKLEKLVEAQRETEEEIKYLARSH